MKGIWMVKTVFFVTVAVVAMASVVMWLWNWLIPDLFHGTTITFLQAIGLMLLCRILFRGFTGFKGGHHFYERQKEWKEKWEKMDPDEREKMKALWKKRCSRFSPCDDGTINTDKKAE